MKKVNIPVVLDFGTRTVEASAALPDCAMRPADLVPILLGFTEAIASVAADLAAESGRQVSCRAGCGACCRQLVPISESEAVYLAEWVEALPAEARDAVGKRFEQAKEALGPELVERLRDTEALKEIGARRALGEEYFARGVACPFLIDERCSIHRERPAACREYLVSSPPENCRKPSAETIEVVRLPLKPSGILYCFGDGIGNQSTKWVPLVLALEWAEARKGTAQPVFPGPQMFRNFIAQVQAAAERNFRRG